MNKKDHIWINLGGKRPKMANKEGLNIMINRSILLWNKEREKKRKLSTFAFWFLEKKKGRGSMWIFGINASQQVREICILLLRELALKTKKLNPNHLQLCLINHEELRRYQRIRKKKKNEAPIFKNIRSMLLVITAW